MRFHCRGGTGSITALADCGFGGDVRDSVGSVGLGDVSSWSEAVGSDGEAGDVAVGVAGADVSDDPLSWEPSAHPATRRLTTATAAAARRSNDGAVPTVWCPLTPIRG